MRNIWGNLLLSIERGNDSMSGFDEMIVHYLFQTAATIMKHNSSCSALQMVCDPLLKEIVSTFSFV